MSIYWRLEGWVIGHMGDVMYGSWMDVGQLDVWVIGWTVWIDV